MSNGSVGSAKAIALAAALTLSRGLVALIRFVRIDTTVARQKRDRVERLVNLPNERKHGSEKNVRAARFHH
jgi:hypothetical protein